eukprot:COSAG02_NODE_15947_length_1126_cov_2.259981_1_plen_48_part_10
MSEQRRVSGRVWLTLASGASFCVFSRTEFVKKMYAVQARLGPPSCFME